MPYNIQISRAHEFIRATPNGVLDFEQSKKLLVEIASAVLNPFKEIDKADFFALSAQLRGFPIRAFISFEDAIEWLCKEET